MFASGQATAITLDCQVSLQNPCNNRENRDLHENYDTLAGTFQSPVGTPFDAHELDQIEAAIEKHGQEFKRQLTQHAIEAADRHIAQTANPELHKHGTRPFTIVARCGDEIA